MNLDGGMRELLARHQELTTEIRALLDGRWNDAEWRRLRQRREDNALTICAVLAAELEKEAVMAR